MLYLKKGNTMIIERKKNEVVIRLDASLIDIREVQAFADYFRFIESNARNKGTEEQATELARKVQKGWWAANRNQFIK